jgi:tetratricopeptide (TPR) repeat protein
MSARNTGGRAFLSLGLVAGFLSLWVGTAARSEAGARPKSGGGKSTVAEDSILSTALRVAETSAIPKMRRETNLTWQSGQLTEIAGLYAKAGRYDEALRLIRDLDTPDHVKAPAFVPIAIAAIRAGDLARAESVLQRLSAMEEEWTEPIAVADIAIAMDQAGNHQRAARLVSGAQDPVAKARAFLKMKRLTDALRAARDVAPGQMHVPGKGGARWEANYGERQSLLLELVTAFVDRKDLPHAREALSALESVPDRELHFFRARALIEIARAGRPVETLQQALREIERAPEERLGDFSARIEVQATVAERLVKAGQGPLAIAALDQARAEAVGFPTCPDPGICEPSVCAGLVRIARADLALGKKQDALDLLDRAARVIDGIVVPPPRAAGDTGWDSASSTREHRVEGKAQVAAVLEQAGEAKRAGSLLGSALAELAAIGSAEWRGYAWHAIVRAYRDAGRPDRAIEILAASGPATVEKAGGIMEFPEEELLALPRERLWSLLRVLPACYYKIDLSARLAARLEARGSREDAARLTAEALTALAAKGEGWEETLVHLANELPGAGRPGDEEQRRLLRSLAPGTSGKDPKDSKDDKDKDRRSSCPCRP